MTTHSAVSTATRNSIKKYFGLGGLFAIGTNGPFTMHDIDNELFPAVWSFIAEVLEVEVELNRLVMEEVSVFISKKNGCPICINAHTLLEEAAKKVSTKSEKISEQAVAYAESLFMATRDDMPIGDKEELAKKMPDLTDTMKAEIALVLIVYQYMNRVVRALLGKHVSVAMFGVPRRVANMVENETGFWIMKKVFRRRLSMNLRKKNPGITRNLFQEPKDYILPAHLKGAELAGVERARAVSRLYHLVDTLYESRVCNYVSFSMLDILDDPANRPPPRFLFSQRAKWIMTHVRLQIGPKLSRPIDQSVALLLLLVDIAPEALTDSSCWKEVNEEYGEEEARVLVFWYALRCSVVTQAKGLDDFKGKCDDATDFTSEGTSWSTESVEEGEPLIVGFRIEL